MAPNSSFTRDHLFDLSGKVALVTGGGSGIGLMATQALAANGVKVYITGRTKEKLDKVVEQYGKDISGQIIPIQGDISSKDGVKAIYEEFSKNEDCCCILVNNAGINTNRVTVETEKKGVAGAEEMRKNLFEHESADYADWQNAFQTNVTSAYFMTTAFLGLLERSSEKHPGWSSTIINTTSISGLVKTAQRHFAYNASKAAALHLTRMTASEVASNGLRIRINSIAPGVFPSEMTAGDSGSDQKSDIPKEEFENKVPARRPGKDEDMAQTVLFGAACQYLNGVHLVVDGGYTLSSGM